MNITSQATDIRDSYFISNGVRIRYIEQGVGEPVILTHGIGATTEWNWVTPGVFQELAKSYRMIAMDLRGHGKSDRPRGVERYGHEMVLDVVRLMDHLKIDKAHIIGYSMGGAMIPKLLTICPERFLSATMAGSAALFPTILNRIIIWAVARDFDKGSMKLIVKAFWPKDQPKPTPQQLNQFETDYRGQNDMAVLAAAMRGNMGFAVTKGEFSAIKAPLLGIAGAADPNDKETKKLKELMPAMKVITLEKASHWDAFAQPNFIESIRTFLQAHSIGKQN